MAYLAPTEFVTKMVDAGESKIFMSTRDTVIRAYMAGAILALAAAFAVTINVQTGQPLAGAILFPVGFCLLYLLGFDLLTAVDGMDAWGILERVVPDAVVTDLEMPRLNGLNLIRRMRADERLAEVPAIVISTRGSPTDRQAGLEAGADAYLSKAELGAQGFKQTLERLL